MDNDKKETLQKTELHTKIKKESKTNLIDQGKNRYYIGRFYCLLSH